MWRALSTKPSDKPDVLPQEAELSGRIQRLELKAKRLAAQHLLGRYRSRFRGRGLEFRDFREYVAGDDVRTIDWNVTARFGRPFVRNSEEERELHVVLVVDLAPSQLFGSGQQTKAELSRELAGLLALTALRSGDRVGLLELGHESQSPKFLAPGKGRHQKRRILQTLWSRESPSPGPTQLAAALEDLLLWLPRRSFIFLVSDFLRPEILRFHPSKASDELEEERLLSSLRQLSYRHETVALRIFDRRERQIPKAGNVLLHDLEDGRTVRLNTNHSDWQRAFQQHWSEWDLRFENLMKRARWDSQDFQTDVDPVPQLSAFLDLRRKRR